MILACAISAGVHGALAPEHFGEGAGGGAAFVGATVVLALLAVALTRDGSDVLLACASVAFAGLIAAYAVAVTTGLPLVHPEAEPVGGLALATKAVEAVGLLAAATQLQAKGTFR